MICTIVMFIAVTLVALVVSFVDTLFGRRPPRREARQGQYGLAG